MSKSRPNGQPPKKKPKTTAAPAKTPAEKKRDRYIFGCVGMILYVMPALSCLGMSIMMGADRTSAIIGIIVGLLGVPLGLLGMHLFKKQKGRMAMGLCCALLAAGHVYCALILGGWYMVLLPDFILILLCVSGMSIIEK